MPTPITVYVAIRVAQGYDTLIDSEVKRTVIDPERIGAEVDTAVAAATAHAQTVHGSLVELASASSAELTSGPFS